MIYRQHRFGERLIAVADIDGSNLQTIGVPYPSNAVLSPKGDEIAIAGDGIYIVRIDGSGLRKIAGGERLQILEWR